MRCERHSILAAPVDPIAPGAAVVIWCRDRGGDGHLQLVSESNEWRGHGRTPNAATLLANDSTLEFPTLEAGVAGSQASFFVRDLRAAHALAESDVRRLDCTQLGACMRSPFKPAPMRALALVWAFLMIVLIIVALSRLRHRMAVLALALYTAFSSLGRMLAARGGDAHPPRPCPRRCSGC